MSFYGGKPGSSFAVVQNFSSVSLMVENFAKGPNYTDVNYDEYVLINTVTKTDPDNGKIYRRGYDYTDSMGGAIYIGTIAGPGVANMSISADGTITTTFTDGSTSETDITMKWIDTMSINSADSEISPGNQKVHVVYNTGDEEDIGSPLNYIMRIVVNSNDYHLLALYSDPAKRSTVTYDGVTGWTDLGAVRDYSGILVGPRLKASDISSLSTTSGAITYLNTNYASGLTGENKGKVLTIIASDDIATFYAFDYDAKTWYSLGTIEQMAGSQIIAAAEDDSNISNLTNNLIAGGVWFIEEND